MTAYFIGHMESRVLRRIAGNEAERAAVERLADGKGTEADVQHAVDAYVRLGMTAEASELLWMIPPPARLG